LVLIFAWAAIFFENPAFILAALFLCITFSLAALSTTFCRTDNLSLSIAVSFISSFNTFNKLFDAEDMRLFQKRLCSRFLALPLIAFFADLMFAMINSGTIQLQYIFVK